MMRASTSRRSPQPARAVGPSCRNDVGAREGVNPQYLARARSQACARWRHALQQRVNVEDCYRVDDQEVELARVGDRTEAPGYLAAQQVTEGGG
jgi:hypothetical protein